MCFLFVVRCLSLSFFMFICFPLFFLPSLSVRLFPGVSLGLLCLSTVPLAFDAVLFLPDLAVVSVAPGLCPFLFIFPPGEKVNIPQPHHTYMFNYV